MQTHLAAVTYAGSARLKMDTASGPLPELYTAFTTWLSHAWCMLSIILSASSIIWTTGREHPFKKKKKKPADFTSLPSALLCNVDSSCSAFMNSQETWVVPDPSLNSCWCDQPVDPESQRRCRLNCVSCPPWKKDQNKNKKFHYILCKYEVQIPACYRLKFKAPMCSILLFVF